MEGNNLIKKGLAVAVILLFIGVAFVPCVNAKISKPSDNDWYNDWYICPVAEGDFRWYCSLALDSNNYPHIIGTWDGHYIHYARWNGSEWEHFDKIYEVQVYPYSNSMVLDSEDSPHICYYTVQHGYCHLKYATLNGTKWDITDIDYGAAGFAIQNSIDIDSQNNPHIVYTTDYYTGYLKYAKFDGYEWQKEIVDDSWKQVANAVDFALDANDYPYIAYYDGNHGMLRYAKWNGYEWEKEIVDDSTEAGQYLSLVLDDKEQPHISYVRRLEGASWWYGNIKYAYQDEQNWTIEEVTTGNTTGWGTSIALDSNGNPCITYIDGGRLEYASRIDGKWESEIVVSGYLGYPSLALDSNDNLYIGYCNSDGLRIATTVNFFNNHPPNTPETPSGPTEGVVGVEYTFCTSTTDPGGEQVSYLWDWGDETPTEWTDFYDSGATACANHTWSEPGDYDITVKAKNIYNAKSNWSDPLAIHIIDTANIEIGNITGGLFKVTAEIKNNGGVVATGVDWSITLDGGLILLGKETYGNIPSIPAGDEAKISSSLIFGFGRTVVTVTADIPESSVAKEQDAFVLLFFIMINHGG